MRLVLFVLFFASVKPFVPTPSQQQSRRALVASSSSFWHLRIHSTEEHTDAETETPIVSGHHQHSATSGANSKDGIPSLYLSRRHVLEKAVGGVGLGLAALSTASGPSTTSNAADDVVAGSKMRRRSVRLNDALSLQAVERGKGTPTILFLHGYGDSWYSFNAVMNCLPENVRAISLTQRGHGDSSKPVTGYGMKEFASDALAVLDVLGINEKIIVVGHSMGSLVAQEVALVAPNRVSHLVLIGSATTGDNAVIRSLADEVEGLSDPISRDFVRDFQTSTLAGPIAPSVLAKIIEESLKVPARVWKVAATGVLAFRSADRLASIRAPTLIVWGEKDAIFSRAEQDALVAGLPRATLMVYDGAGHGAHWEQPERFTTDLVKFVGE